MSARTVGKVIMNVEERIMEDERIEVDAALRALDEEFDTDAQPSDSQLSAYERTRNKLEASLRQASGVEVKTVATVRTNVYMARSFEMEGVVVYGYVFNQELWGSVSVILNEARMRKYEAVLSYVLSEHPNAVCDNLWEEPCDHWHLLVWYRSGKPTDTRFHRAFFVGQKKGENWNSNVIRNPRSMMQYVQCEPRKVTSMWVSKMVQALMLDAWNSRHEMKEKIKKRDENKGSIQKKRKWAEDDWYEENGSNPQTFTEHIISHGCVSVASFLNYAKRNLKGESYGSFIFSRDKPRLEKEINESIKRHYFMMDYFECLSTRVKQLELLVSKGGMYGIGDSIEWLKKICMLNRIEMGDFVRAVISVLNKVDTKKNTLYIWGEANSLKSTVCRSIVNGCPNIGMQISSADFPFNECTMVNLIFSEETKITEDVINILKRVYEGAFLQVNRKNKDAYALDRTPVICCSNYSPGHFVPKEKRTMEARMFLFRFYMHEELKQCNKMLNPLMWEQLQAMYEIKDDEFCLY